jgi:HK97 family phage portal protein
MPMSDDASLSIITVFTCVAILADSVSTLPLVGRKRTKDRTKKILDPAPTVIDNPWPEGTLQDFLTQVMVSLALRGNSFNRVTERDVRGYPTGLMPLHPDSVIARRDPKTGQRIYRVQGSLVRSAENIDQNDMVHIPALLVPGSFIGLNPVEYMRSSWALAAAAERYGGQFFANSANPSGIISVEEDMSPEEARELKRDWQQMHGGISNAQYPAVLTGGAVWHQISITPDDAQFLQTRDFQRHEIASFFRIPEHMLGFQDRTSSWGCLPAETQVFTVEGPRPIVDITVGDEVWSLGEKGMAPAKVTGWQMTGYRPLLTFETTGRTVRATSNHHMMVRRYFGRVDGRRMGECGWENLMVDAKDVRIGDYFMVPHGLASGYRTVAPNGRALTVGAMEFCGLYSGDGSLDGNRVEIAHECIPDHMDHYRSVIETEFGAHPYTNPGRMDRTRFSSTDAVELLRTGFTGTALTKRVPGWVFRLTPQLQFAFLRGYLDADGSVQRGRIVYSSANVPLLEDVRHLCIGLGIPVGRVCFGRAGGEGTIRGRIYQSQPKWQLALSSVSFNSRIGSNSPRKAARFIDTPTERRLRYDKDWRPTTDKITPVTEGWEYSDVILQRVTNITAGEVAMPVYDIEVEGNHTFVADGVVVGNTGIEQMEIGFVINTLRGWLGRIETYLSKLLPPSQVCKFDLKGRLRGDTLQRFQAYTLALNGRFMNVDEVRELEDLPELPNGLGKSYWGPLNFAPIDKILDGTIVPGGSGGQGGGIDQSPNAPPAPSPPGGDDGSPSSVSNGLASLNGHIPAEVR